jgi:hypothetical protein
MRKRDWRGWMLSIPAWLDLGRALRGDPWRSPWWIAACASESIFGLRISVVSANLRVFAVRDQYSAIP